MYILISLILYYVIILCFILFLLFSLMICGFKGCLSSWIRDERKCCEAVFYCYCLWYNNACCICAGHWNTQLRLSTNSSPFLLSLLRRLLFTGFTRSTAWLIKDLWYFNRRLAVNGFWVLDNFADNLFCYQTKQILTVLGWIWYFWRGG